MNIQIDSSQISHELQTLAGFSAAPAPAVTRVVFSEQDQRAREWLRARCLEANLQTRTDAIGNFFARWSGTDNSLPAIATGSHIDAIPHSGQFDGTVGVLGGLEAIRALRRAGFQPRRSLELLMFTSEEPTRFGIGCLGSRLLSNSIPIEKIAALRDTDGLSLQQILSDAGFFGTLSSVPLPPNHYAAFLELHIEQGPLLEHEKLPIGIVTAIAAPAALRITLEGQGGHAGALLMPDRIDALCAAAEITLRVESIAKNSGSPDSVATTGILRVHPAAINSVPSRCELEIDIRDTKLHTRDAMVETLRDAVQNISAHRGIRHTFEIINADPPATCDPTIITAAKEACSAMNLTPKMMVSRAYHDSLFMARICPTAMLFIPCRGGLSHRPDEFASPEDIARGTEALARTMASLAS